MYRNGNRPSVWTRRLPASGDPTRTISVARVVSHCGPSRLTPTLVRSLTSRYVKMLAESVFAMAVPHAAPAIPRLGAGPSPNIRTAFRRMFVGTVRRLTYMGVRVSPAPWKARAETIETNRKNSAPITIRR
jgi:hypothetical protein